jgi:hypothetical protein
MVGMTKISFLAAPLGEYPNIVKENNSVGVPWGNI